MFSLDGDLCFTCHHCGSLGVLGAETFQIQETGWGNTRVLATSCPSCGQVVGISYSLEAQQGEREGLGYFTTLTRVSPVLMELHQEVSIVRDPMFRSQVSGLTALDYHRTLLALQNIRDDPSLVDSLNRRMFEQVTAECFRRLGFSVELTKKTRDGGRDIIGLISIGPIPFKIFVECKRNDPGNPVGVSVVRSLYGVQNTVGGPNKSILVSATHFTDPAKHFVTHETGSPWELDLYGFHELMEWANN